MYYENESDFDQAAWDAALNEAKTGDDFLALLRALPTEKLMTDDEAIERFKGEPSWAYINGAESMLGWCRFWLMAHWVLPMDQQARCVERLMSEGGYSIAEPYAPTSERARNWHRNILALLNHDA